MTHKDKSEQNEYLQWKHSEDGILYKIALVDGQ